MQITRENYESFFIDYLEGNLDRSRVDDFIEFLQQNPDLKEELTFFESVTLEPSEEEFPGKENLLKHKFDHEESFNRTAVAKLEGDLTNEEELELENWLVTHPEKGADLSLFAKTKLQPDQTVVYTKKKKLYRLPVGRKILLWSVRVAAVLVIALVLFNLIDRNQVIEPTESSVAETRQKEIPGEKDVITQEQQEVPKIAVQENPQIAEVRPENKDPEPAKASPAIKAADQSKVTSVNEEPLTAQMPAKMDQDEMNNHQAIEALAATRIPLEVPGLLAARSARIDLSVPAAELKTIIIDVPEIPSEYYEERLLGDVIKEKTGLDKFKLRDIPRAGLKLVQNLSNEKFTYETDGEGKVTEYKYDSRLLAFSIQSKKD